VNASGYCSREPALRVVFQIAVHLREDKLFQLYCKMTTIEASGTSQCCSDCRCKFFIPFEESVCVTSSKKQSFQKFTLCTGPMC